MFRPIFQGWEDGINMINGFLATLLRRALLMRLLTHQIAFSVTVTKKRLRKSALKTLAHRQKLTDPIICPILRRKWTNHCAIGLISCLRALLTIYGFHSAALMVTLTRSMAGHECAYSSGTRIFRNKIEWQTVLLVHFSYDKANRDAIKSTLTYALANSNCCPAWRSSIFFQIRIMTFQFHTPYRKCCHLFYHPNLHTCAEWFFHSIKRFSWHNLLFP